jgi:hypothetical protein
MSNYSISQKDFKKAVIAFIIFLSFAIISFPSMAQSVVKDAQGNYHAIKGATDSTKSKSTGHTFTDNNGQNYPIFEGSRGGLYYMKTSKAGNTRKVYLPKG